MRLRHLKMTCICCHKLFLHSKLSFFYMKLLSIPFIQRGKSSKRNLIIFYPWFTITIITINIIAKAVSITCNILIIIIVITITVRVLESDTEWILIVYLLRKFVGGFGKFLWGRPLEGIWYFLYNCIPWNFSFCVS